MGFMVSNPSSIAIINDNSLNAGRLQHGLLQERSFDNVQPK